MVYRALDVANYIVQKSLESERPISNLKLQKILYYLQARSLVETGEPLFTDSIEKWRYGPVISSVYHEYKLFGSSAIEKVSNILKVERDEQNNIKNIKFEPFDENCIELTDKEKILKTVDALAKFGAFELVAFTHEQSLWKDHEDDILMNRTVDPYSAKEIEAFFVGNEEEQLWKNN